MIRQEGYNIIIEMEAPPKSLANNTPLLFMSQQTDKTPQQRFAEIHREMSEEFEYKQYIDNLKREIKQYAEKVFTKDIAKNVGKEITKEAVKCVNDVVKQTLK